MKEQLPQFKGMVKITKNGVVIAEIPNLIVTTGREWIVSRLKNTTTLMSHIAVGTDNTAAVVGDTTLVAELARVEMTTAGGVVSGNAIEYEATFAAGVGTGTWVEAGIFNNNTAGTMLSRTVFPAISKGELDSITITWTISYQS